MPDGAVSAQRVPVITERADHPRGIKQETFDAIVADMRTGTALRQALLTHGVSKWAFFNRIDKSALSADQYARARVASLDAMAEETVGIADDPDIASDHKRVMVDTRKWLLSKMAPKRYGDHLDVRVSTGGEASALTDAELIAIALRASRASAIDVQDNETSTDQALTVQDKSAP